MAVVVVMVAATAVVVITIHIEIQSFIIYVLAQKPQGQLHRQHRHKENTEIQSIDEIS